VADSSDALQVAFAHLFFNVFGIIIWYPIPLMRHVPIHMATQLGKGKFIFTAIRVCNGFGSSPKIPHSLLITHSIVAATRVWKGSPLLYILICFFGIPGALLGLSAMFTTKEPAQEAVGSIIVVIIFAFIAWFVWYWRFQNGKAKAQAFFQKRQRHLDVLETLPYDMVWAERCIKEMQATTDSSPAEEVTFDAKEHVHEDCVQEMDYITRNVTKLVEHLDLHNSEEKENLGSFYHKENEPMP
jgi:sodium-dependent phosphate cotransporter